MPSRPVGVADRGVTSRPLLSQFACTHALRPVSTDMHRADSKLSSSSLREAGGAQERGTYSCSREASPLNACLSIDWISFLYK